jgi:glycosyltransferase involved in cell wall biosynthesis
VSGHRLLHVVHDFLPRHRAGVEIYTAALCRELSRRHHVTLLTSDYDPSARHGELTWRVHDGLPVVEIRNNWEGDSFDVSYRSDAINARIEQVLETVQPHVVHVHSLLNLSFDLPAMAQRRGIKVVTTLHDYTLVCPSGGQRLHRAESHVCHDIDVHRCARCFPTTDFHTKLTVGRMMRRGGRDSILGRAASWLHQRAPRITKAAAARATRVAPVRVAADDIVRRLDAAKAAMSNVNLLVAPSASLAAECHRLGVAADRITVADYGFVSPPPAFTGRGFLGRRSATREGDSPGMVPPAGRPLRVGYVGSLVWHKGVHVLIGALQRLAPERVQLSVHGDPALDPGYAADLRAQASGLSVGFRGPFEPAHCAEVYENLDVLVVPSLWLENSPLVIHEALLAGVPVIGSEIGGIPGLIRHEVNGLLVQPGSVDALARALERLAADRGLLDRLRQPPHGVKRIEDDAAEWEARYAQVVAGTL